MRKRTIETPERIWVDARWISEATGLSYQAALNMLMALHPARVGGRYLIRRTDFERHMRALQI